MAFHISELPESVQTLFNKNIHSPALWPTVVQEAVQQGVTDPNKLADIVFYLHHPDLILSGITRSNKDFKALSDEWTAWFNLVKPGVPSWSKKKAASEEWEYYSKSHWSKSDAISNDVKSWLQKPPTHEREVGIFKSELTDNGRPLFFLTWKTLARDKYCRMGHTTGKTGHVSDSGALFGWMEWITSLESIRKKHNIDYSGMAAWAKSLGLDCGVEGIAADNAAMNIYMFHFVMSKGRCLKCAEVDAYTARRKEAKAVLELVGAVVGGAGGAKSAAKVTPISDVRADKFAEQIVNIVKGKYKTSPEVDYKSSDTTYNKDIYGKGGKIIGKVKYFD